MGLILFIAAILPIIALCVFIYLKDKNKEPKWLLAVIFILGLLSVIPVLFCELFFEALFPMDTNAGFVSIFFNVLFGVAMYEESFKWLITKYLGYKNKEFDEVYDVIVYSVFASLGFACFENVMYVLQNGLGNAFLRAFLAIPGHTCFAISMGYFFSKAKVGEISGNKKVYSRNIVLSIVVPIILHTFYDAFLFSTGETNTYIEMFAQLVPFFIFYIGMVVTCFITVDKAAKVQQNLNKNIQSGNIVRNDLGYIYYEPSTVPTSPIVSQPVEEPVLTPIVENSPVQSSGALFPDNPVTIPATNTPSVTPSQFCPICGKNVTGANFCSNCGLRLK